MTNFATPAPSFTASRQPVRKEFEPISGLDLLELELELNRSPVVSCGSLEIDELLGGGFERGCVVGVSSVGVEGRIISLNLLASIILPYVNASTPLTRVIVVDTTGHFPLPLLDSILRSRIISSATKGTCSKYQATQSSPITLNVDEQVHRCLQMVGICRVFDIGGLWEVIREMRRTEYGLIHKLGHTQLELNGENIGSEEKKLEIMDSELELSSPCGSSPVSFRSATKVVASPFQLKANEKGIEMILIDNMTTLASDLLSPHDQLEILSRELHTMTRQYKVLTFLHNTTVSSKTVLAPRDVLSATPKSHSVFHSNPLKPALGQIFAQLLTLHLFLSPLPQSRQEINASETMEAHSRKIDAMTFIRHTTIVEVLKDESPVVSSVRGIGWRERRWTAVNMNESKTNLIGAMPTGPVRKRNLSPDHYCVEK
ncbi:hypothetical protein K3495_g12248 [Podosphaera aphanis]|nr:hypothetical protein K3495_g12248 [Podosphaera aphanis]